jgi:PPP family 3-phenylpropionic acid transporter
VVMVVGGFVLSVLASFVLPSIPRTAGAGSGGRLGPLLRDKTFLLFMIAGALIQSSHNVLYGFGSLHWEAAGHSSSTIGWLWAESAVIEVVLFACAGAIVKRVGVVNLLIIGACAAIIRWTAIGWTTALPVLAAAQALHALTFGATHLGAMHFIARTAPPGMSARAQMAYSAVALGIGNGLTLMSAGVLYQHLGASAFYVMSAQAALGLVACLALARMWTDPTVPARPA